MVFSLDHLGRVSEERLRRFFVKEHRGYRARRELREAVLFAVHDVVKDAPFSRLDLVTCRNLLIYLTLEAQTRASRCCTLPSDIKACSFSAAPNRWMKTVCSSIRSIKKHRLYRQRPTQRAVLPVPIGPSTIARAAAAREFPTGGPICSRRGFRPPG